MIFTQTILNGAYILELQKFEDERGFFARTWCQQEFKDLGINAKLVQCNISFNKKKGTLRGMHYQTAPYEEAKLIWCTRGAIYDVIIDIRPHSKTFKQWVSVDLTAENRKMLFIPEGFAHGFLTLMDCTEVVYQMSEFYMPEFARGIRWNDPAFHIQWPSQHIEIISEKDKQYSNFIQNPATLHA
jgi:dTDP-4-dehydrorhamnose 3,5-epimerase